MISIPEYNEYKYRMRPIQSLMEGNRIRILCVKESQKRFKEVNILDVGKIVKGNPN